MKKEKDLSVAVLIDGDNASFEKMEDVMRFVGSPRLSIGMVEHDKTPSTSKTMARIWVKS